MSTMSEFPGEAGEEVFGQAPSLLMLGAQGFPAQGQEHGPRCLHPILQREERGINY